MRKSVSSSILLLLALLTAWSVDVAAQVPSLFNYQGKVSVGTAPFQGTGKFKFALVDAGGGTTLWSNDGTSNGGSEPKTAVAIAVVDGLYTVQLGDAGLANMTSPIPASALASGDVYLRVWFSDGTNGSQWLSPDKRIASVAYALVAASLDANGLAAVKDATQLVVQKAIQAAADATAKAQAAQKAAEDALAAAMADAAAAADQAAKDLAAKDATISQLQKDLADANASIAALNKKITDNTATSTATINRLNTQLQAATTKIATLNSDAAVSQKTIKTLNDNVTTLTKQLADANASVTSLTKDLADAKAACDASTAALQKQIDDLTALINDPATGYLKQIADLKAALAAASTTLLKAATK